MDTVKRVRISLDLQPGKTSHLVGRGQDVAAGFEGHATLFLIPNPTVSVIKTSVQDLITAQLAMRTRAPGSAETRNVKANALVTLLYTAGDYVQGLINNAPPDQGAMIAKSAGMYVALDSTYSKPVLKATQALPGGLVHLEANISALIAGVKGKVSFNWQFSGDGGKTWLSVPSTPHGRTDIASLTALATYAFRVSITSRQGPGPWCDAITFLVH